MNQEQLFAAIGKADEAYLEQSEAAKKKQPWGRIMALAACAALVLGLAGVAALVFAPAGSQAPAQDAEAPAEAGADGSVAEKTADGSSIFLSYAGPILPLTLAEDNETITAERNVTLDFSRYAITDEEHLDCCRDLLVTDEYLLTNHAPTDQMVTVLYPYVSSYRDRWEREPALTVDGSSAAFATCAGDYAGGYYSVDPDDPERAGERWNLKEPQSWEEYQALLSDGSYLSAALAETEPSALPVTVYTFTDLTAPENVDAATLGVSASYDETKTIVLTYNFNGQQWNEQTGQVIYDFFVNNAWRKARKPLTLLIVIGEDLDSYTVQGYENGACERSIDGVSATVIRTGTSLEALLKDIARDYLENLDYYDGHEHLPPTEEMVFLFASTLQEALLEDGALSDHPAERYDGAYLDMLVGDTHSRQRIFYQNVTLTIPAGKTVNVTATLVQPRSFNFYGSGAGSEDVDGYDLVTSLGSNLTFTTQTAALVNVERIEIVSQNYGFDPANSVTSVDLTGEHYYLEVRKAP